ncbi:V-type ATP synthase subunit A [Candidatus Woesearchaeota archaeon]|nr:MAG: V-type ATP synthase subunit A [Candidatus Woesearchaeota archaeon]
MKSKAKITKISGPVIQATGLTDAKINDVVLVGNEGLLAEIIEIVGDTATIQVYEETDGLKPGEPVVNTQKPLSVALAPGLLTSVFDGVQRPLESIKEQSGTFITRGINVEALDTKKKWDFKAVAKKGDEVKPGDILGEVQETSIITHKIMVPPGVSGKITSIESGKKTITQDIAVIGKTPVQMLQYWPVKRPRPYLHKEELSEPLITGQRIYDIFFPSAKGGQCAIPGPFGSGKTVTQQAIAKWCDAQIIVYIGCGERGNEMTEVLREFPHLQDPKTGKPLMDRTVLVANTSNMPVAAREASIYTGMTIAEYYRDMGYDVALMADSTSRWAEAMREISGRLEEMPGEEGYPAYLATKLAQFYERAGKVKTLNEKQGSITVIGAVSPAGGDFSEPVTQNTLKIAKVFWALDAKLAAKRHYWAINWLQSYSLYTDETDKWYDTHIGEKWSDYRKLLMSLLQQESSLLEIAQLVGKDSLPEQEQFILLTTRLIREDILQQNAFNEVDMYCDPKKQYEMMKNIAAFFEEGKLTIAQGKKSIQEIEQMDIVEKIGRMKYEDISKVRQLYEEISEALK